MDPVQLTAVDQQCAKPNANLISVSPGPVTRVFRPNRITPDSDPSVGVGLDKAMSTLQPIVRQLPVSKINLPFGLSPDLLLVLFPLSPQMITL